MTTNPRTELKFLVHEHTAAQISRLASEFMRPDPYALAHPDLRYPVHSLYLDSPGYELYWNTVRKVEPRLKLRVRFYDEDPSAPLFLEIKSRLSVGSRKTRLQADRDAFENIIAWPLRHYAEVAPELQEFKEAVQQWNASPVLHVGYSREPFISLDNPSERLTLDREIQYERPENHLSTTLRAPDVLWPGQVVLELKYDGEPPEFFGYLVKEFGLKRARLSKYVSALRRLARDQDQTEPVYHLRQPGGPNELLIA